MMLRIVTQPEWESRVPPSFRRRGETYWTSAELPIPDEWVFMIRTRPAPMKCVDSRTLLVVTVERLLELLEEVGEAGIQSVYHLCGAEMAGGFRARLIRLSTLDVAEDSQGGWRRVFLAESDGGDLITVNEHQQCIEQMVNRKRLASFPTNAPTTPGADQ